MANSSTCPDKYEVFIKKSLIPIDDKLSSQYSKSGLPLIGTKHFGIVLVTGLSLVPKPADNNKAFNLYYSKKFQTIFF